MGFVECIATVEVLVSGELKGLWVLEFFGCFATEVEEGEVLWWRGFWSETGSDEGQDVEYDGSGWD
jgi:hypothetical protein